MQSIDAAKTIISDNAGITIELYDATYTNSSNVITRFLDEDVIIMLPSKSILADGVGDMATVAHPLANYTYGYYTWQETKNDPYVLEVGVGLDAFPRIIHPEALLNAKIA
jgi:hypothetical protein